MTFAVLFPVKDIAETAKARLGSDAETTHAQRQIRQEANAFVDRFLSGKPRMTAEDVHESLRKGYSMLEHFRERDQDGTVRAMALEEALEALSSAVLQVTGHNYEEETFTRALRTASEVGETAKGIFAQTTNRSKPNTVGEKALARRELPTVEEGSMHRGHLLKISRNTESRKYLDGMFHCVEEQAQASPGTWIDFHYEGMDLKAGLFGGYLGKESLYIDPESAEKVRVPLTVKGEWKKNYTAYSNIFPSTAASTASRERLDYLREALAHAIKTQEPLPDGGYAVPLADRQVTLHGDDRNGSWLYIANDSIKATQAWYHHYGDRSFSSKLTRQRMESAGAAR